MAPADPKDGRSKKMRRIAMMLGAAMLLLAVAAGAAMADHRFDNEFQCRSEPCSGTDQDDVLYERTDNGLNDTISGFRGADAIDANTFRKDRDRVFGGPGSDRLLVNDGDARDVVGGGDGRDVCYVDPGDRVTGCESVRGENQRAATTTEDFDLPASEF